jgi:RNA polymerase sigma-70 factor, ECF subfamily
MIECAYSQEGSRRCDGTASLLPKAWFWRSPSLKSMIRSGQEEVRTALAGHLTRLWRYGLVLAGRRDVADDLVQATCLRALERAHQFETGTRVDRWLFSILHSIWINEVRSRRVRQGEGVVDAETALSVDGMEQVEARVLANQVIAEVRALPEGQREAVFLVYVEGLAYREAADVLHVPIGTIMSRLAAARAALSELNEDESHRRGVSEVKHP